MARKNKGFKFGFAEFIFILLVVISSTMLTFNSGKFVLSFKKIGFSVFSSIEKCVFSVKKNPRVPSFEVDAG